MARAYGLTDRQRAPAPGAGEETGAQPLIHGLNQLGERVRAFDHRHPWVWDAHLTGVLLAVAVTASLEQPANGVLSARTPTWLVVLMASGFAVPLLWRRTHPFAALLVMLPFSVANNWTGAYVQASFLQLIAVFAIARRLPLRVLVMSCGVVVVPLALGVIRYPVGSLDQQFLPTMNGFLFTALLGIISRTRKEYTASLVERARRLEVERDQQAKLAAAAERTRIAREMHDIIGHNLSVITGLADGGSYAAAKSPDRAVQALEAISATSRQALTELRRLLGVLREDADTTPILAPQPALTDLHHMVEGVRAAGLRVSLTVRGPTESLPAGRQLTVYRVIQEALTNTLKHAGAQATATVDVCGTPDGVTVTVTDTGLMNAAPTDTGPCGAGRKDAVAGRGLTGMRERTALYDGTLESGPLPAPATGWRVRLHLPKDTAQ